MDVRYLPDHPFPRYAFVPGRHPHPMRDPEGPLSVRPVAVCTPLDPQQPRQSPEFLFAVDLFNQGYYWEAHEAWEELWQASGRQGPVATLLKALIKLAAAGVKSRAGNDQGVRRHAARSAELLHGTAKTCRNLFTTIHGDRLLAQSQFLAAHPVVDATHTTCGLPVLGICIEVD